jgi:hypothetical protein
VKATAVAFALFCSAASTAAERPAGPPTQVVAIRSPAAQGSVAPRLSRGRDGTVWLAWLEPANGGGWRFLGSQLGVDGKDWGPSLPFAEVHALEGEAAPLFGFAAADRMRLALVWIGVLDGKTRVFGSASNDGGTVWTRPEAISGADRDALAPAVATLADGRFLAAWLEEAAGSGPADAAELHARILGPGAHEGDQRIDARTSAGSGPALASFLDGGAGIAYRGLSARGERDVEVSRLRHRNWNSGRTVAEDHWIPDSSQGSGPALAADGGRVFAAWFTGADNDPRLLASSSPDAGERFLMPLTVATGPIVGQPAAVLLHDSAAVVFWNLNAPNLAAAGLWVRRITPDFTLDPPSLVWPLMSGATPSAAIEHDYTGGDGTACVVVAFSTNSGNSSNIHTLELTIPEAALLAAADDTCHCAPTPEQLVGYPIRGTILRVDPGTSQVALDHEELPGILEPGSDLFRAEPDLAASLKPGTRCLARIERRNGEWRIFDVRLLLAKPQ